MAIRMIGHQDDDVGPLRQAGRRFQRPVGAGGLLGVERPGNTAGGLQKASSRRHDDPSSFARLRSGVSRRVDHDGRPSATIFDSSDEGSISGRDSRRAVRRVLASARSAACPEERRDDPCFARGDAVSSGLWRQPVLGIIDANAYVLMRCRNEEAVGALEASYLRTAIAPI
jgi:hypothetical protein